ncbi:glycine betaine ABC transporter substrate-binding protein [Alkalihalobacillus sp. TS-13]|uniref:glycine betaine ABC transporter substrate-binding protein n=1 Tax=Alkalihalobacillus sp. TS-13 TaxID=2842455 RepID=UPI001C867D50|nr:glycine betaine ABC transporter substrate-binding protein [Alkalihalobacillus sp. TS-13]
MKKIIITGLMMMSLAALIIGCSSNEKGSGEASEGQTITFGVTPWTSTVPPTKIAVLILEDMGYTVKETKSDVGGVFMGLSRGDVDVFMDAWLPMHQVHLDKFKDSVEDTAVSYPEAKTGWVVPTYMEDVNKISDLKGKEDAFNNEMLGIEEGASATKESDKIIKAYDLDMKQVNSSEGGMIAEATRLMAQEKPVVFYGWRPHTMFNKYDLKVLEDDKGFFGASSVHVITNKDLKEKAPEAYEFLSNWNISIDEVEKMIVEIEENGKDPEKVAREWIENNQDKVKKMKGEK